MGMRPRALILSTQQHFRFNSCAIEPRVMAPRLRFSDEVREALAARMPVVALESTIISHGMPYPQNVQCAREVESVVRQNGATPATIGIIKGEIYVGMSSMQLEAFGQTPCAKVSRRDLASIVGQGRDGATTVAATMMVAHMAGINVFVTGGIGGVHRGAEETWDVSADITELGRTPVAVVCAGAKSILDLPKTMECLETQGVAVIGLRTSTMPAFFTQSSGLPVPTNCETEEEVAAIIAAQMELGIQTGIVVGTPIPAQLAAEVATIELATTKALAESVKQRIVGRDVTPFLLKRINELTGGESLRANVELVKHNALVGAKIAAALHRKSKPDPPPAGTSGSASAKPPRLAVLGGAVLDYTAKPHEKLKFGEFGTAATSVPGTMRSSVGGVGRSLAETISKLAPDEDWVFESVVGDDSAGDAIASACRHLPGILHRLSGQRTATYTAMLDGTGELVTAVADMGIFDAWPLVSESARYSRLLLADTNLPQPLLEELAASRAGRPGCEMWVEPVSIAKATKIVRCLEFVHLVSPNLDELRSMVEAVGDTWVPVDVSTVASLESTLPVAVEPLLRRGVHHLLVTCGSAGAVLCSRDALPDSPWPDVETFSFPDPTFFVERRRWSVLSRRSFVSYVVPRLNIVESVTGAGDSVISAAAWAYGIRKRPLADAILHGLAAAWLCLASSESVSPLLSPERITPKERSRL